MIVRPRVEFGILMFIIGAFAMGQRALGVPVQWTGPGSSGHWYEFVDNQTAISWTDARLAAESMTWQGETGHLATLTSSEENAFLVSAGLLEAADPGIGTDAWIGGWQNPNNPGYAEPAGGWEWVTGESWNFTNWEVAQPDDSSGEDYLSIYALDSASHGRWNDLPHFVSNRTRYVVEYIPAPGAAVLAMLGLPMIGWVKRRFA